MINLPPHQREREYQIQVCHWQMHHAWRTPPSRGAVHKCYTNSTLHQAENYRLNWGFHSRLSMPRQNSVNVEIQAGIGVAAAKPFHFRKRKAKAMYKTPKTIENDPIHQSIASAPAPG